MRIHGSVERKDAQAIHGWVVVEPREGERAALEIVVDGQVIGTAEANLPRPDLKAAGFGEGDFGFAYDFPPNFDAAQAAAARIRLAGTGLYLSKGEARAGEGKADEMGIGAGSIFILGPARSGTSVTFLAMSSVLGLSGLGEGHVLPIFQRLSYIFYEHVKQFAEQPGVLAARLSVPDMTANLVDQARAFYANQFGGGPFVDKTPGLEALVGAPFVRKVFPAAKIIVTTRNGVEVVESYRRKFKASFEDACLEFARCATQIRRLRQTMPDVLFLDQNEMRATPEIAAQKLADHIGRPEKTAAFADFLRGSRQDVLSDNSAWAAPPTLETIGWSEEEKATYMSYTGEKPAPVVPDVLVEFAKLMGGGKADAA